MNKKGFTLAELLGVIVILSIIAVISVIAVDTVLKNSRYTTCLVQEENLIKGAESLTTDYPDLLPSNANEYTMIPIKVLQDGGVVNILTNNTVVNSKTVEGNYIEENLENPMTEEPYVNSDDYVKISVTSHIDDLTGETVQNSDYKYEVYYQYSYESCSK